MEKSEISHYDLCQKTAKRFFRDSDVVLWEYKSYASIEEPDVLCFKNSRTTLYEIKVSRSDFLSDKKKDCRVKYKTERINRYYHQIKQSKIEYVAKPIYIEAPHLGLQRYFVCPWGMIQENEVGKWGLIWHKGRRFYMQKRSKVFKRNVFAELSLMTHAIRKYNHNKDTNIMVRNYSN